jgi:hypothetical protein
MGGRMVNGTQRRNAFAAARSRFSNHRLGAMIGINDTLMT